MRYTFKTIMTTVLAYLTIMSTAHAMPCTAVSEPAGLLVALTTLSLFLIARRRKTS
jgi:hypothetical protein